MSFMKEFISNATANFHSIISVLLPRVEIADIYNSSAASDYKLEN